MRRDYGWPRLPELFDEEEMSVVVSIQHELDAVDARSEGVRMAVGLGFPEHQIYSLATVVTELSYNIAIHAYSGSIHLKPVVDGWKKAIHVNAMDTGPGIQNVILAMNDGYSSKGTLGSGLPGVKRLTDSFSITSSPQGTIVNCCMWKKEI